MKTVVTRSVDEAASLIKRGGTCAFATETVYGLGASVFDEKAIAKIFEAKRRPSDNPLIAHVSNVDQITDLTAEITRPAKQFIEKFFPGPLTVVLRRSGKVPTIATAGLDTIATRMPRHELARKFIAACGTPLVAPSANLSGRPSPTTWQAVLEDLDGRIDCILQGEPTEIGLESTVVDCTAGVPVVLRVGAVSIEDLQKIVPETRIRVVGSDDAVRSPGVRHKHYSPRGEVRLVSDLKFEISNSELSAYVGLHRPEAMIESQRICTSVEEYAHELFEFFRECDRKGIGTIYCEEVPETGLGAALMDRLRRAAEQ